MAESAISALVQINFLVSHFAGVTAITNRNLDSATLQTMAVSILVSCCSTGLSFAGKDKKDGSVLGLPGKVDWSPTMVSLVLVRAMETASRMVAFNIVQVSLRGGWCGHLGGPMAVLFFVAAAGLCFPEAEISDVLVPWILVSEFHLAHWTFVGSTTVKHLRNHGEIWVVSRDGRKILEFGLRRAKASVVAHPGQILEPQSLLPLWSVPQEAETWLKHVETIPQMSDRPSSSNWRRTWEGKSRHLHWGWASYGFSIRHFSYDSMICL